VTAFIDERRGDFGVEPICRVLGVSASAYYQRKTGDRSARSVEDERLLGVIRREHTKNYEAYGYRRLWKHLLREGERVPRCQVQRLMRNNGIQGAKRRGKPWRTTKPDPAASRRPDLLERDFTAERPNQRWVADLTYLRCFEGVLYFAFILDIYSRTVVGWQAAAHMRDTLVIDALEMAVAARHPDPQLELLHHSDRGSQGGFNWSLQRLSERGCNGQAGWVDGGVDGQGGDEVAGEAVVAPGCGAVVLAGDREGRRECAGRRGGGGVAGGWQPVVPRAWRDANVHAGPVVGAISVV
jgi:hypothetical protein